VGIVAEEAGESILWLELLQDTEALSSKQIADILKEARELTAIFSASQKTARKNG
jgi:four helix bundle protein